jgi:predicted RNA-binding Zn-ribbon protein involved in translation (DUF1610 family)
MKARNIPVTHVIIKQPKENLTSHKQSRHKSKKYPCDSCKYQANDRRNLTKHKQSKHEGKKYPCDSCDYQATRRGTLPLINSQNMKGRHIPVTHVTIEQLLADP